MDKTVTIRLESEKYRIFKKFAEDDNRSLSNFIETATLRYIDRIKYSDDYELNELKNNEELNQSIRQGLKDMKNKKVKRIAWLWDLRNSGVSENIKKVREEDRACYWFKIIEVCFWHLNQRTPFWNKYQDNEGVQANLMAI